ncbi:hypothetical protein TVD_02825 [Thioalkalivibrio versutus]|uniref:Uncharacterized protein n=1 Tax=Thioalkalivibrio versutus TaxID=106634 RepID=A0A0G3G682_9GAMM|nr:hypothetical protein TVD_02825 [Thioalkalivibrio versutus]
MQTRTPGTPSRAFFCAEGSATAARCANSRSPPTFGSRDRRRATARACSSRPGWPLRARTHSASGGGKRRPAFTRRVFRCSGRAVQDLQRALRTRTSSSSQSVAWQFGS